MKKMILVVLFVVLFMGVAQAQTKKIWFFGTHISVNKTPDLDGWTVGHIAGGAGLQFGLKYTTCIFPWMESPETRFWSAAIIGFVYEWYIDGLKNKGFASYGSDAREADFTGDTSAVVLGASIGYIAEKLNEITKSKMFAVTDRGLMIRLVL